MRKKKENDTFDSDSFNKCDSIPFIAGTMHHARDTPVEETVACLESRDEKGTRSVVSSTASIRCAKTAQVRIFRGSMATTAPLCPWDHQQVSSRAAFASSLTVAAIRSI